MVDQRIETIVNRLLQTPQALLESGLFLFGERGAAHEAMRDVVGTLGKAQCSCPNGRVPESRRRLDEFQADLDFIEQESDLS